MAVEKGEAVMAFRGVAVREVAAFIEERGGEVTIHPFPTDRDSQAIVLALASSVARSRDRSAG